MDTIQIDRSRINRILVLKPRAIGDVLLSTPILPNLRTEFPKATIDFFVEKFAAPVVEGNPFIDSVISIDTAEASPVSTIGRIRKTGYDLVIDLFSNPRTAIITMFSGAPYRVGFPFKWRKYAYNIIVIPRSGEVHNVEFNLDALRRIGIPIRTTQPTFILDNASREFADNFIKTEGLSRDGFLTINIGGGWQTKRWPIEKFIDLCHQIEKNLGLPIVVLFGPSERDEALKISRSSKAISAPQTSLHQMGAIMKLSRLLITNDSGPMHIAAALMVPTLAIFGPTNPKLQGPYGNVSDIVRNESLDCLQCNLTKCPINNLCMNDLQPDTVFRHLLELIQKIQQQTKRIDEKARD